MNKKAVLSQGNRAMPQFLSGLNFANNNAFDSPVDKWDIFTKPGKWKWLIKFLP